MAKSEGDPAMLKLLGANIARARGERLQSEIAQASGIDSSTISDLENGRRNPSVGTVASLAVVLGVELGDLFRKQQKAGNLSSLEARIAVLEEAFAPKPARKAKR